MSSSYIIRSFAAVVLASALAVVVTGVVVDEALGWNDRLGLGGFVAMIGILIVAMVHCHRHYDL